MLIQASIPSSDMCLSYSCSATTMNTVSNVEVETNPSYGNLMDYKSEQLIVLDNNVAYEIVKDHLVEEKIYETIY